MDADKVRALRLADPFVPFRLRLTDGREFDVRRPFHLAMAQNKSRILVVTGADTAVWFSPEAVRDVEPLGDSARSQPSGAAI